MNRFKWNFQEMFIMGQESSLNFGDVLDFERTKEGLK